LTRS
jgi:hypothetical protein